jgi:hypothetical protein
MHVQQVLDELSVALNRFDCERARQLLMQTVAEYKPMQGIQDLVWSKKIEVAHADVKNVTALQSRRPRLGFTGAPPAH